MTLDDALSLAATETRAPQPVYRIAGSRKITRRGVFWLGQTCNLRCQFCYFLDRIQDDAHPEHHFMSLEKAKALCKTLVDYYGNNSVDIQGGEPTLYPHIYELVSYCAEIGLSPTLITNGQVLSDRSIAARYRDARIRDFLVSVQALGDVYDRLVGRAGAHAMQMKGLRNLQEVGIPFRFNTVLSKVVLPQLPAIAELAVRTGAEVVNFLGFNPFNDQTTGKRSAENVPTYTEVGQALDPVLDRLAEAGIEANVRYLPLCIVAERHRPTVYDFPQIPYDAHENDFASWSWTDLPAQRMRDAPLAPPFGLGPRLELGRLRAPIRRLAARLPSVAAPLHAVKQRLERAWARNESEASLDVRYREDARMRAEEYTGYRHVDACKRCDLRAICDGFYTDYAEIFGASEARPITTGGAVDDPQHYTRHQRKKLHPLDCEWLESH
jgi:MoaA/NifB/PqqE/SkfB family radical SAM enzyme